MHLFCVERNTAILVYFLKFLHILIALSVLGTLLYCIFSAIRQQSHTVIYSILLALCLFALLTGSLLVLPKHYTFTTPWIQAAYLLVAIFASCVSAIIIIKKKFQVNHRGLSLLAYFFLVTLIIVIIHDAVTKSTFLF